MRILGGEPLFDGDRVGIVRFLPCRNLAAERLPVRDAPGQALTAEHADSALGDVQPCAVFRHMMNFETLAEPAGLILPESMVKTRQLMRVEISCDQYDFLPGKQTSAMPLRSPAQSFFVRRSVILTCRGLKATR